MTCNCKLPTLVESHDLAGLQKAIENPDMTCLAYPCHFHPGLNRLVRDYVIENQSIVEKACVLGHLDMVELFLHNGCSANLPTSHGRLIHTVLTSLKGNRHLIDNNSALHTVKLLMLLDCDVNVKDYKGTSPLMMASELADPGIMKEILDRCLEWQLSCPNKDNGHTPLHMACMNGSVKCVSLLLERLRLSDIDAVDKKDNSPLYSSFMVLRNNLTFHSFEKAINERLLRVQYSHIAIIHLLLNAGASPTRKHIIRTALSTAFEYEHKKEVHTYPPRKDLPAEGVLGNTYSDCHVHDNIGKLTSPYAELVRMLIAECNTESFKVSDFKIWQKTCPCIEGLLSEVDEYLEIKKEKNFMPYSLMHQSRKVLRLHIARCDKLNKLEQLPLPRKLKDFVRYIDF